MPDPTQLPYLIRLLDDESEIVRESVTKELAAFGESLHVELEKLKISPSPSQMKLLRSLLVDQTRRWVRENWHAWMHRGDDKEKLEQAMSLISDFLSDRTGSGKLSAHLDKLANDFVKTDASRDALTLATYLFRVRSLRGAQTDYLNPRNSDLVYVIEEGKGIPISLACIYILVAHRFGLNVEGINFPGHFLAGAEHNGQMYVVDCFHGGVVLDQHTLVNLIPNAPLSMEKILALQCHTEVIVNRVLRNLINAFNHHNDEDGVQFVTELLHMLSVDPPEENEGNN